MRETVIRRAVLDDYGQLCELFSVLDELHRARLPWLFRTPPHEPRSREYLEKLLASEDEQLLVAEDAAVRVGVVTVSIRQAPDFPVFVPQKWGVIDNLVVLPTRRRLGVGSSLLRAAEDWTRSRGVTSLELTVYQFNDEARAFYESAGYLPLTARFRKLLGAGQL